MPGPKGEEIGAARNTASSPLALTFGEAGRCLGVSDRTIRRLIEAGELEFVKVRGAVRIPYGALARYVASNTQCRPKSAGAGHRAGSRSGATARAARELESLLARRPLKGRGEQS